MLEIGSWSHILHTGFLIYIYIYTYVEYQRKMVNKKLIQCYETSWGIPIATGFARPSSAELGFIMFLNHLDLMCSWTIQLFNSPNTSGATTAVTNILLEFCLWCYLHMNMAEDRVTPALTTGRKNDKKNNKRKQHILSTSSIINTNTQLQSMATLRHAQRSLGFRTLGMESTRQVQDLAINVHSEGFPQPNLVGKDIPFHWNALKRNMLSNSVSKHSQLTWCSASISSTVHVAGDFGVGFSLSNTMNMGGLGNFKLNGGLWYVEFTSIYCW